MEWSTQFPLPKVCSSSKYVGFDDRPILKRGKRIDVSHLVGATDEGLKDLRTILYLIWNS